MTATASRFPTRTDRRAGSGRPVRRAPHAVVIGAGHNGLVCAIRLARAGMRVTVLEQASRPGGGVRSAEATLPGHVHDLCAGFFPLTRASPHMRDLPLERHGLRWIDPPVAMAHPFAGGGAIALHRDVGATAESLDAMTPGAGDAWRAFIEPLLRHAPTLIAAGMGPLPPVRPAARLLLALRRDAIELGRRMAGSAATLGLDLFGAPRPAAWLAGSALHSDLTPGAAGGAGFATALLLLGHLFGWPYPEGGAGRLTAALVAHLRELGGIVRCDAPVAAVEAGTRVRGVRLAGGEAVAADVVVCTLSAGALARLLPPGALHGRVMRRLRRWRYGLGTLKADFALAAPVPWTDPVARDAGVVHVGGELDDLFAASYAAGLGRMPERPTLVVGQHTVHDPSRAPAWAHTLYAYARVPQRPGAADDDLGDVIERRIEAFAPGFRDLVRARAIRSPARIEAENPSLVGGDLSGGSVEVDQLLVFRPAPELCRGRTPLPGLYVAGPSVHPGPGVHGASGANAAAAVIADRRRVWR